MGKITPLYNSQEAQSVLNNLLFQKKFIEDEEYFVSWVSHTLCLNPEQEKAIRDKIGIPKGEFEGLQKRIQVINSYTQPTKVEEEK